MNPTSFLGRKLQRTLGFAIVCLAFVTVLSLRGVAISSESKLQVLPTHRIPEILRSSLLPMARVESNAREYGLRGPAPYLQFYSGSRLFAEQNLAVLRPLVRHDSQNLDAAEDAESNGAGAAIDNRLQMAVRDLPGEELGLPGLRDMGAKWHLSPIGGLLIVATCVGWVIAALVGWNLHRDPVKRDLSETALHNSEENYRSLLDGIQGYAIFMLDPAGTILSWNAGVQRMHGYTAEEIVGQDFSRLFPVEEIDKGRPQEILRLAARNERQQMEIQQVRRDGSRFVSEVVLTALRDSSGKLRGFSKISRDLTARITAEKQRVRLDEQMTSLTHSAEHDPLTGLPNRMLLSDRINQAIALAKRNSRRIAVLFLDLDGFKYINDSLGHSTGDEVLRSVARCLLSCVRSPDTVSRNGGDEFVIVLQEMEQSNQAAITARRVLNAVAAVHPPGELDLRVTTSVGVSIFPEDGKNAETLIRNADIAMYKAKASGGKSFVFFTPEMNVNAVERQFLEDGLRHALQYREFALHYQPKVNVKTGAVVGAEALVRWIHPTQGLLLPGKFISLAEETGLILPIGVWGMREACLQAKSWKDAGLGAGTMAVNISTAQFRNESFVQDLHSILTETGLDPHSLELEVTENVLMKNAELAVPILKAVRDIGVRVSVDNFGTGYSSLSYLQRFPLDALKIDRSCLHKIYLAPDDSTIVSAIIGLGRAIGLRVIAEGVESAEELSFLQANDCDEAQGYYFSRPIPAEEFAKLLAA